MNSVGCICKQETILGKERGHEFDREWGRHGRSWRKRGRNCVSIVLIYAILKKRI